MTKAEIILRTEQYVKNNVPTSREPSEEYYKHVFGARDYATKLTELYSADAFVTEMAILLHDIGANSGPNHAAESAKIAEQYLAELAIDQRDVDLIIKCIKNHSMGSPATNLEE